MTLLTYAQRIQALAQSGLAFSKDFYDIERYTELQEISFELLTLTTKSSLSDIKELYLTEKGYATPKIDVRALILDDQGAILMVMDSQSYEWSLPGGYADVG